MSALTWFHQRLSLRLSRIGKLCACFLLVGLCGCFVYHKPQPEADLLDDKVTTERVQAALSASPQHEFQQVRVRTDNGVLFLSGFVSTPRAKDRAGQLAETTHRPAKIQNDIQIRP